MPPAGVGVPRPPGVPLAGMNPQAPPILGAPGASTSPLACTLFHDGPSDAATIAASITTEGEAVTRRGVQADVSLWQRIMRPGQIAYFTLVPGSNVIQVALLGLVTHGPGMIPSRYDKEIIVTLGEAHGNSPTMVASMPVGNYALARAALNISLPPLQTVINKYISGARAMTDVYPSAMGNTPGAQCH